MQATNRVFSVADFVQPSDDVPIRSVLLETPESVIVVWFVQSGQEIAAHLHPTGQDTWTILSGSADYYLGNGARQRLVPGQVAVARPGEVHGAFNTGDEPFVFVSVVTSDDAGYQLAPR